MNINDFNDILHTRIIRLMTEITGLPDNLIINVKNNRGAFPQKVIKTPDHTGRTVTTLVPFNTNDIFAVYLVSESPTGMSVVERIGETTYAKYDFQVELLFYGARSSFYAQHFVLNAVAPQIRLWMQYAEMSWTEIPAEIETMDTMINNEWWIIRKLTLQMNVGLKMTFPKGELIESFEHSLVTLGGIEL